MKKLLLLLSLILFGNFASAQDNEAKYGAGTVPFVGGKPFFSIVESLDGRTADQLYAQAKLAVAEMFKSAQNVIQLDDPTNKIIIAKGNYKIDESNALTKCVTYVSFMMKIACKDGRYKVDLTDFNNSITIATNPPVEIAGSNLTDANCINKKGECKKSGYGLHRRMIIDTKDVIFTSLKDKMSHNSLTTQDDW